MNNSYIFAQRENQLVLDGVYRALESIVLSQSQIAIQCQGLNEAAFVSHDSWPVRTVNPAAWDWRAVYQRYARQYPRIFSLSIWHDGSAIGLGLGKLSDRHLIARLGFVEGAPGNVLEGRLAPTILRGLELYAGANEGDIDWVGIQNPLPVLRPYYRSMGYDQPDPFDPGNSALCRRLQNED